VNLAARIEPIVAPGEIWTTKDYAQLLGRQDQSIFQCISIGQKQLPKGAGVEELSVILRAHEPNPYERGKEVAVAIVVKDGMVLLVRRIDDGEPMWQFPAGQLKPNRDAFSTAVREVKEETGIDCSIVMKIGERKHPDSGVYVYYFHAEWTAGEAANGDPEENDKVEWVTPAEALGRFRTDVDPNVRKLLETLIIAVDAP
jgi:8-oxo-dGTP pyrophosphatase MutT (NUDIX family)